MSAELATIQEVVQQKAGVNGANLNNRASITEKWYWRISEGKAPLEFTIRPYVLNRQALLEIGRKITDAQAKAGAITDEVAELSKHTGELRGKIFLADIDNYVDEVSQKKLDAIQSRIDALEKSKPNFLKVKAEEFFLKVIVAWPLEDAGEPVPLTAEGVMGLDEDVSRRLEEDLTDFLWGERGKKKKK